MIFGCPKDYCITVLSVVKVDKETVKCIKIHSYFITKSYCEQTNGTDVNRVRPVDL